MAGRALHDGEAHEKADQLVGVRLAVPPAPDTSLRGRRGEAELTDTVHVQKLLWHPDGKRSILESLASGHLGDRVDRRRYDRDLRSRNLRSSSGRRTPTSRQWRVRSNLEAIHDAPETDLRPRRSSGIRIDIVTYGGFAYRGIGWPRNRSRSAGDRADCLSPLLVAQRRKALPPVQRNQATRA
jgi:hypothetical protein